MNGFDRRLIRARSGPLHAVIDRLAIRAATQAAAEAETRLRARMADAGRWRRARLLWPDLFSAPFKDQS